VSDQSVDVVVVGAGGDGPALAWRLGQLGLTVLILEAGPWHGHEDHPEPHEEGTGSQGSSAEKLSGSLLEDQFTGREFEMNNVVSGKLRWGPADRARAPWFRVLSKGGMVLQVAGVGGTTLHYFGNHPRAYPMAINQQDDWPISYEELVPYYQCLEEILPVKPAPTTPKEEVFYEGCRRNDWPLISEKNVTDPGYRPMPNAIFQPDSKLGNPDYQGPYTYPEIEGSTLSLSEYQGDAFPEGAPFDQKSKRSANVSFVPKALETGNVSIQPNAFVTEIMTDASDTATGVRYRDTWTGEVKSVEARTVALAGGCVETPRLWKNSDLPENEHVGTGLTTHWLDFVSGTFDEQTLRDITGQPHIAPYTGQSGSARLDYPGLGAVAVNTFQPGITAGSLFGFSREPFSSTAGQNDFWDISGKLGGSELKRAMANYPRRLSLIIHTDDRPREENEVTVDSLMNDEHGPVPQVNWSPHRTDSLKRKRLAELGAQVLREAGANTIHRTNSSPIMLHLQSTMRMGKVTDEKCEAKDVNRLFIADHSVLPNSLGGPNPTHTGQALALRTAESIADRYFEAKSKSDRIPHRNSGTDKT
jgi:choline dehydrogenase-like flavoprotein